MACAAYSRQGRKKEFELGAAVVDEVDRTMVVISAFKKSKALELGGDLTGAIGLANNVRKGINEWHTNKWAASLHFLEAGGQVALWVIPGGEEVELLYNIGSYAIDTGIEYYDQTHEHKK